MEPPNRVADANRRLKVVLLSDAARTVHPDTMRLWGDHEWQRLAAAARVAAPSAETRRQVIDAVAVRWEQDRDALFDV